MYVCSCFSVVYLLVHRKHRLRTYIRATPPSADEPSSATYPRPESHTLSGYSHGFSVFLFSFLALRFLMSSVRPSPITYTQFVTVYLYSTHPVK